MERHPSRLPLDYIFGICLIQWKDAPCLTWLDIVFFPSSPLPAWDGISWFTFTYSSLLASWLKSCLLMSWDWMKISTRITFTGDSLIWESWSLCTTSQPGKQNIHYNQASPHYFLYKSIIISCILMKHLSSRNIFPLNELRNSLFTP